MPKFEHRISSEYLQPIKDMILRWRWKTRVDILIVVDTEIATQPGVGFGIGSVIELIRDTSVGCMHFTVDIALRNGEAPIVVDSPAEYAPKYRGFRFDMEDDGSDVIDKYEQIWCFGFKPSNSGSADDAEIDQASRYPASDSELAKLSRWMDERKGGLFGTGDHHFLGASMCRRIPRLGTMRRWTNADGVPPIGTPNRIDTLRPPSPAYEPGNPGGPLPLGNTPHQGDATPQPIQWRAWRWSYWPIFRRKRPHPVLCHPTLGPIDVMPDHAHEGLCVPTSEIAADATYNFDGGDDKAEYPASAGGGPRPMPEIIAYGKTLGDPPYNFAKGAQPARPSFPMISVYDGHRAGVGRVATDSTWHHWMDVNIQDFKSADDDNWKKISRYFINLAVWLSPPAYTTRCFFVSAIKSHFEYPGFEEYWKERPVIELGRSLRHHLARIYGPCWVTDRIWVDILWERRMWPWELLEKKRSPFDFGGIDAEVIEDAYLGSLVQSTLDAAERIKSGVQAGKCAANFEIDEPEKAFASATKQGVTDVTRQMARHYEETLEFLRSYK